MNNDWFLKDRKQPILIFVEIDFQIFFRIWFSTVVSLVTLLPYWLASRPIKGRASALSVLQSESYLLTDQLCNNHVQHSRNSWPWRVVILTFDLWEIIFKIVFHLFFLKTSSKPSQNVRTFGNGQNVRMLKKIRKLRNFRSCLFARFFEISQNFEFYIDLEITKKYC